MPISLDLPGVVAALRADHPDETAALFARADAVRRENVGDEVHLRGLVEFSNYCARSCAYCGIRAENRGVTRYRMSHDEILAAARDIVALGYGTIVLQSGEDWGADMEWVAELLRKLKGQTPLAVTLSLGERGLDELAYWRQVGADRYLLRFETGNQRLYDLIHPAFAGKKSDRFALLRRMRELGYEVGSGVLIGIPGQTYEDLARDILRFPELDLDMIGVGPYIPHPDTPLAKFPPAPEDQVPATVELACRVVALARLLCPQANIPSTTALASLEGEAGRAQGLRCGANILMPNVTPDKYRRLYEIYPAKAVLCEVGGKMDIGKWLETIGRGKGRGRGDSPNRLRRATSTPPVSGDRI